MIFRRKQAKFGGQEPVAQRRVVFEEPDGEEARSELRYDRALLAGREGPRLAHQDAVPLAQVCLAAGKSRGAGRHEDFRGRDGRV